MTGQLTPLRWLLVRSDAIKEGTEKSGEKSPVPIMVTFAVNYCILTAILMRENKAGILPVL
jgi:hypothetical protein